MSGTETSARRPLRECLPAPLKARARIWLARLGGRAGRARGHLTAALADRPDLGRDWTMTLMFSASRERGARDIFLCRPGSGAPLVAKVYADPAAATRAHGLMVATRALTDRVVTPIFLDAPRGVVAMEWAGSETLRARIGGPAHAEAVADAAHWLRRYHDDTARASTSYGGDAPPFEPMREPIPPDLPPAIADRLTRLRGSLEARRAAFAGLPVSRVEAFADFKPENLVHGPRGWLGIDRPLRRVAARELDVSQFLLWVEEIQMTNGAADPDGDRAAFTDHYGADALSDPMLDLLRDATVAQWWMQAGRPGPSKGRRQAFLSHAMARAERSTPRG